MRNPQEIGQEIVEIAEGSGENLDEMIVQGMIGWMKEITDPREIGEIWIEVVETRKALLDWMASR